MFSFSTKAHFFHILPTSRACTHRCWVLKQQLIKTYLTFFLRTIKPSTDERSYDERRPVRCDRKNFSSVVLQKLVRNTIFKILFKTEPSSGLHQACQVLLRHQQVIKRTTRAACQEVLGATTLPSRGVAGPRNKIL